MAESDPGRAAPITRATDWWLHYWRDYSRTAFEANRAVASAFGLVGDALDGATIRPHVPSVAYDSEDWSFERSVDERADVGVGDHVSFMKRLSDGDVRRFARASGDTNRLQRAAIRTASPSTRSSPPAPDSATGSHTGRSFLG